MQLYHFTTKRTRDEIEAFSQDKSAYMRRTQGQLNPGHGAEVCYSHTPRTVLDNWSDFFNNPERRWMCYNDTIPFMQDITLWQESQELGRLLYFIKERGGFMYDGFALAQIDTKPQDKIFVCEADHLRRFHEGETNSFDAHIAFAESRVPLDVYLDNYTLPEYRVKNKIPAKRIKWKKIP